MDSRYLIVLGGLIFTILCLYVGRLIYLRGQRVREQLKMSAIFTNITHELLTPLTVVSASVDKLREEEPKYGHDYDMMQLNIQRMVRLLQQILETSKAQSGDLRLRVARGDVMRYVHETAQCLEPLLARKRMHFSINCHPESMMGWIDTDKLDKIIYNLLSNAAKYTSENGDVGLEAFTDKDYEHIIIKVSDTGSGISSERMKNLFRRFQDGDYRQYKTIGTGLGLALTHDLVYLNRGTITCQSEEGQGTTFTVTLPIYKEAFDPEQIDEDHQIDLSIPKNAIMDFTAEIPDPNDDVDNNPQLDEDSYKLLIVEDNVELLMLMRQLFRNYYRVYVASNGKEALKVIHQRELDLIISDVMMPEMGGYELTHHVKSDPNYNHLPVILLTAKTQEEDEQKALEVGADGYLTKPFRLVDLKLRIDNIIENRKRMQHEYSQESVEQTREKTEKTPSPDEIFLRKALDFVNQHLEDEDYDRDALAADMGASASTLYNKLRAITGMNVSTFIRDIRMKEAKRIADSDPTIRVSDLAYRVGFHDPRYFSTCFKKQFGIQPKEYMEQVQKGNTKV